MRAQRSWGEHAIAGEKEVTKTISHWQGRYIAGYDSGDCAIPFNLENKRDVLYLRAI